MTTQGPDLQAIHEALLAAFPTTADLDQMLRFRMNLRLAELVGPGSLSKQVFDLLITVESRGRLDELVGAAAAANPGNALLGAVAAARRAAVGRRQGPAASAPAAAGGISRSALRAVLQDAYSLDDLRTLCADIEERLEQAGQTLSLSLEDLPGATKGAKALSLIEFMQRRRQLDVLVELVSQQRPGQL